MDYTDIILKRETEDGCYPDYLGFSDSGCLMWYGSSFDELISDGLVHNLWFIEDVEEPVFSFEDAKNYSSFEEYQQKFNAKMQNYLFNKNCRRTEFSKFLLGLALKGLMPKEINGRKYQYYFIHANVQKHYLKEIGRTEEKFVDMPEEDFEKILRPVFDKEWEEEQKLYSQDPFRFIN